MVRPNELSFARRGALSKLAARRQGARPSQLTAVFVGLDAERDDRAIVSFDGSQVSVLAGPVKMVPGALCAVEVDSANAPVRVLGPVTVRPAGLDEDIPAPDPVTAMPTLGPRELTEAEAQAIQDTADGLAQAQQDLAGAEGLLTAIGAGDGPEGVADALTDYLAVPLDQVTVVDNRGAGGEVIAQLYDAIIVEGLLVADEIITGSMLADGAVTARTLNVVPEEGTGGVEILPPGIRVIPSDAEAGTAVSMRVDEEAWISFAQAGETTFSVNPAGHLTAQQVDANTSLTYRGDELADLLAPFPRGNLGRAIMTGTDASFGSEEGRLVMCTIRTPPENRLIRITFSGRANAGQPRRGWIDLRQSKGNSVTPANSSIQTWRFQTHYAETLEYSLTASVIQLGWNYDETITVGVFVRSDVSGETIPFQVSIGQHLVIDDIGLPTLTQGNGAWVPSTGGGSGGSGGSGDTGKRDYTYKGKSSWVRSFLGNNNHYNYGAGRAYQGLQPGTSNGNLKSMIGWPSLTTTLSGATIKSVKIRLKNLHTYSNSGGTAYIGLHGRTSAPSTFAHSESDAIVASFTKGQTRTLSIPSTYWGGFVSGAYRGISLYTSVSSNARYGYWDGANAELIIEYEK